MVRTLEELLDDVRALGEDVATSDAGISLIENITDSIKVEGYTEEQLEDAKQKVEEIWRKKYVDRFYNNEETETIEKDVEDAPEEIEAVTYEDLFEEKEER